MKAEKSVVFEREGVEILEDAEIIREKSKPLFIAVTPQPNGKIKISFYGRQWKFVMPREIEHLQELENVNWDIEGIVDFEVDRDFNLNVLKLFL